MALTTAQKIERGEKQLEDLYYKKGMTVGRDRLYEAVRKAHPGTRYRIVSTFYRKNHCINY